MMRVGKLPFIALLAAFLYAIPLNINITYIDEKPVDFSISNIFLILSIFLILIRGVISRTALIMLGAPLYFLSIGIFSSLQNGGSTAILLSSLSFSLPLLHVLSGSIVAALCPQFRFHQFAIALSSVIYLLLLSDLLFGSLPSGCGYEGRWGGCLGTLKVYGFPNASMGFLAVCSALLAIPISSSGQLRWRLIAMGALIVLCVLTVLSLSRSAVLVLSLAVLSVFLVVLGKRMAFIAVPFFITVFALADYIYSLPIFAGLRIRMDAAWAAGDITTGRIGIWMEALEYFATNPFFGSGFLQFSQISDFGTTHQQYAEVLFKVGIVGFALYFGVVLLGIRSAWRVVDIAPHTFPRPKVLIVGFGFCLFVSSIFQSALSYQVMGNFVFFACGYFATRHDRLLRQSR